MADVSNQFFIRIIVTNERRFEMLGTPWKAQPNPLWINNKQIEITSESNRQIYIP